MSFTEEQRTAARDRIRQRWADPEFRAKQAEGTKLRFKRAMADPEYREKKRAWAEEMRTNANRIIAHRAKMAEYLKEGGRAARSLRMAKNWEDPSHRDRVIQGIKNRDPVLYQKAVKAGHHKRRGFFVPPHLWDEYQTLLRNKFKAEEARVILKLPLLPKEQERRDRKAKVAGLVGKMMSMALLMELTCQLHDVTLKEIRGNSRVKDMVAARFHFIALVRCHLPNISLSRIGRYLSRDHTTIMSAIAAWPKKAPAYQEQIDAANEFLFKAAEPMVG